MKSKSFRIFIFVTLVCVVTFAQILFWYFLRDREYGKYQYLSPRIFAENQNDIILNFTKLRAELRDYIGKKGEKLGVYFEYLPSGSTIGIKDKVEHRFASLLKVPVVMAYYLEVEEEKQNFDRVFTIKEAELDDTYGKLYQKGAGAQVTARELIDQVLIHSDNTALHVLANNIKRQYLEYVFDNLDIVLEKDANNITTISPKKYSSIFKALYLSSILPKEKSNEILEILSKSTANDTLAAGVPTDVRVANKIGEIRNELYWDCGVIYEPKRPYLVCAFSTDTTDEAKKEISTISRIIHQHLH